MKKGYLVFLLSVGILFLGAASFAFFDKYKAPKELQIPLGLPPIPWPVDNHYDHKKADLGRLLYFDKRLSSDGTVSCASCHSIPRVFSDGKKVSIGINGQSGTRHSPTLVNVAYQKHYFWDGRAASLEEQCKGPLGNPKEMTLAKNVHEAHMQCQDRICKIAGYRQLFKEAFDTNECNINDIAKAVATFERTILSGNAPYDRYIAGDKTAMTAQQIEGMRIFKSSGCANCHFGYNFTDGRFTNIGVGMDVKQPDLGRYEITKDAKDWGAFKIPTLRETAKSAPYMHDGSQQTLEEVIDYYDKGGIPNKNLHPLMKPLHLTAADKAALKSFLEALSGEGWQHFQQPEQFPQ